MGVIVGFLVNIAMCCALAYGGVYSWREFPQVRQFVREHWPSEWPGEEMIALEARFSEQQLVERFKKPLLSTDEHHVNRTSCEFHPYLLMEVKFNKDQDASGEGILLWSLEDGEMVLRTSRWATTHGFADCLDRGADRNDLRILNTLARRGWRLDRQAILTDIHADPEQIDTWLESCRHKQLIVQHGNTYRIHLQNPIWATQPTTEIESPLVQRGRARGTRTPKYYTQSKIEELSQAVFGSDFAVRSKREVYLPVYLIEVQNPDGSKKSSRWNAFTGEPYRSGTFLQ